MESYTNLAPFLFFAASDDGKLLEINSTLLDQLQYGPGELNGNWLDVLFPVASRIFYQTHLFPLLKLSGRAGEIYLDLKKRNGELLPVLLNVDRCESEGTVVLLFAGLVVHQRKKFEEDLIAARKKAEAALQQNTALQQAKADLQLRLEELEQQMQLAAKQNQELRQFSRIVTHDMQEPLRKLTVFINLLQEEEQAATEQSRLLGKLDRVTQQLKTTLSGLQQYVWLTDTPPSPTSVDLHQILESVQKQLAQTYPDVRLQLEQNGLPALMADRQQMEHLFLELLENAIRFRREEDRAFVRITADTLQVNRFQNVKNAYRWIACLRLRVKDEGRGFAPEYKAQVFELFRRLDERSGRGIGLSLCKQIVENHHGTISIDSTPDEGTEVTILLPFDNLLPGNPPVTGTEILNREKKQSNDL